MTDHSHHYIPAFGHDKLTSFYDPLLKWILREEIFRQRFLQQMDLGPDMRVLDLGCGTGTQILLMKGGYPGVRAHGVDGDPAVLAIARTKASQRGVTVQWQCGMSFTLPYAPDSFDRVMASLMLHHLSRPDLTRTLTEVLRVLRPGGQFHIVDFGPPGSLPMAAMAVVLRHLERVADHIDGLLPGMIREAGFVEVVEIDYISTLIGPLSFYRAVKAG